MTTSVNPDHITRHTFFEVRRSTQQELLSVPAQICRAATLAVRSDTELSPALGG